MADAFDVEAYLEEQVSKSKELIYPENSSASRPPERDSKRDRSRERRRSSRSKSNEKRYRRRDSRSRSPARRRDRRGDSRGRERGRTDDRGRDHRDRGRDDERSGKEMVPPMTEAEKEAERLVRRERSAERRRDRDAQLIIDRQRREIEDLTKDQRTIFVSQLTKKANERDLENFFGQISKVKNIIMLRDKMSGCHKGFAYVEMTDLESIPNCLLFNNVVPDFQKFPILVKASEAEKNFNAKKDPSSTTYDGTPLGLSDLSGPETRIYLGNIHVSIDESALKLIVDQFGPTESVKLHRDNLGNSKGFAFVKFVRAESAALAMSSLGGMELAGRPLKVGPVIDSKSGVIAGGLVGGNAMQDASGNWKLDTDEGDGQGFQLNSSSRAMLMAKLGQSAGIQVPQLPPPMMNSFGALVMPLVPLTATPAPVAAPPVVVPPVGGVPSPCLLVCNMFDPATETEPEWDLDIREDVVEECARHGADVEHCHVERNKPGGMVFVKLRSVDAASKTAARMNGRFFAGRMITVTYLEPNIYAEMAY